MDEWWELLGLSLRHGYLNGLIGFNPNLSMKWVAAFPVLSGIGVRRLYGAFAVTDGIGAAFAMFQVRCFETSESF